LNNHVFEVARIKVSSPAFKFTYIDPTKLPANVTILDEYSGTDNVTVIFHDFPPGDSEVIELPVYTMDTSSALRGAEKLTLEIIE